MLQTFLDSINQTSGVQGSWLADLNGQTIVKAVSILYSDDLLQKTARKVQTMAQTQNTYLGGSDEILMKFESIGIYVRCSASFMILVVVDPTMNIDGLRIATHLVLQRIAEVGTDAAPSPTLPPLQRASPFIQAPLRPLPSSPPISRPLAPVQKPTQPPPPKKKSGIWG